MDLGYLERESYARLFAAELAAAKELESLGAGCGAHMLPPPKQPPPCLPSTHTTDGLTPPTPQT